MFIVVTGGSGSGKSFYAEGQITQLADPARFYLATMQCYDDETRKRIDRHRKMRAGKGFVTVERPLNLKDLTVPEHEGTCSVLLECMSNLAANEMFDPAGSGEDAYEALRQGIDSLLAQCDNLVVVTNEVFSDGVRYDPSTVKYIELMGRINRYMAEKADRFTEVVYGIPVNLARD